MISDELRRALEKLNQGPLKPHPRSASLPQTSSRKVLSIDALGPARLLHEGPGACLLFERTVADLFDRSDPATAPFCSVFLQGRHALGALEPDSPWGRLLSTDAAELVFLDIETLGLMGTPVFLVGLLSFRDGNLLIRQFFSRDYSEELPMLAAVAATLVDCRALVTFNGKTFDLPTLRDRMAAHLLTPPRIDHHFDLLHESRRRFRRVLPDCRLQTLEHHICRRKRTGDVPGELIPQLYHDFVATGDASGIRDVLHHNALDLVAMVEILTFIAQGGELVWTD
jgi:uncharacterized protein YprB with RNaseH-like and TPR domain